MTVMLADPVAEAVTAARELLTRRTGAPVTLLDPVDLGGSGRTVVLRVRVGDNPFLLPRTLVIKQVRETDGSDDTVRGGMGSGSSAFLREAVSYQFTTALATESRPGPALIAYDLDARLLVLSDLGDAAPFTRLLGHPDPQTVTNSLMAMAQALGRMHAATVGREADFTALLARADVLGTADAMLGQVDNAIRTIPTLLVDELKIEVPCSVAKAAARAAKMFGSGGMRAFSPAELCPDNVTVDDDGVRFLDYEWGGFREATLDVAYTLMSYPGCLCRMELTPDRAEAIVDAWRAEVVGIWPQLADDTVLRAKLLDAHLIWAWMSTYWFLPENDMRHAAFREHHLSVPRSQALLTRWSILAAYAETAGDVDIAEFATGVVHALSERWPS